MSFNPVTVNGDVWSFEHLKSFSFTYTIVTAGASMAVQVDVVFSCHCFTRSFSSGPPPPSNDWVYKTATETRILDRCQRSPHWSHFRFGVLEPIQDRLIEPTGDRLMEPPRDRVMEPA